MPMLTIGALYGRMIGELLVIWFGEHFYYGTYSNKHFQASKRTILYYLQATSILMLPITRLGWTQERLH